MKLNNLLIISLISILLVSNILSVDRKHKRKSHKHKNKFSAHKTSRRNFRNRQASSNEKGIEFLLDVFTPSVFPLVCSLKGNAPACDAGYTRSGSVCYKNCAAVEGINSAEFETSYCKNTKNQDASFSLRNFDVRANGKAPAEITANEVCPCNTEAFGNNCYNKYFFKKDAQAVNNFLNNNNLHWGSFVIASAYSQTEDLNTIKNVLMGKYDSLGADFASHSKLIRKITATEEDEISNNVVLAVLEKFNTMSEQFKSLTLTSNDMLTNASEFIRAFNKDFTSSSDLSTASNWSSIKNGTAAQLGSFLYLASLFRNENCLSADKFASAAGKGVVFGRFRDFALEVTSSNGAKSYHINLSDIKFNNWESITVGPFFNNAKAFALQFDASVKTNLVGNGVSQIKSVLNVPVAPGSSLSKNTVENSFALSFLNESVIDYNNATVLNKICNELLVVRDLEQNEFNICGGSMKGNTNSQVIEGLYSLRYFDMNNENIKPGEMLSSYRKNRVISKSATPGESNELRLVVENDKIILRSQYVMTNGDKIIYFEKVYGDAEAKVEYVWYIINNEAVVAKRVEGYNTIAYKDDLGFAVASVSSDLVEVNNSKKISFVANGSGSEKKNISYVTGANLSLVISQGSSSSRRFSIERI